MAAPVAALLWLARRIEADTTLEATQWVAAIDSVLAGEAAGLDDALGVTDAALVAWRDRHRDESLISIAAEFYSDADSDRAAALALASDWGRYSTSAWRTDRGEAANPYPDDDRRAGFFTLNKIGAHPLSASRIRFLLAREGDWRQATNGGLIAGNERKPRWQKAASRTSKASAATPAPRRPARSRARATST